MGLDRQLRQYHEDWRDCDNDVIALPTTMVAKLREIVLPAMMSTGLSLLQRCNNQTERDELTTMTMMKMKAILMMTIMQQSNRKRERERERKERERERKRERVMMIMATTIT